jgi:NADH pyrophosphatase NudC (nudix superfamily)
MAAWRRLCDTGGNRWPEQRQERVLVKYCGECGTATAFGRDEHECDRYYCPACGWTWYSPPTPVTLVLVTTDDGNVVYARKKTFEPGRWSVVSGFIPRGERAEDTAVREVLEETGLEVEIVRFMGTHFYERQPDQIVIAFHARVLSGTPRPMDDIDEVDVAPPDPSRLRSGSTSWWLVKTFAEEQAARERLPAERA